MKGGLSIIRRRGLSPYTEQPVPGVLQYWEQSKPVGLTLFHDTHLASIGAHGSWSGMSAPYPQFIPPDGWTQWSGGGPNVIHTTETDAPFGGNVCSIQIPAGVYDGTGNGSIRTFGSLSFGTWNPAYDTFPGNAWRRKYECVMINFRSKVGGHFVFGNAGQHKWSYVGTHTNTEGHLGSVNIQFDYSALGQADKDGGTSGMIIARQSEDPILGTFTISGHIGTTEDSLIHTETWCCIEHYTEMSSPGNSDGICWVKHNGVMMAEGYGIDFHNPNTGQQYMDGSMYETVINGTFPVVDQEIAINRISCYYGS